MLPRNARRNLTMPLATILAISVLSASFAVSASGGSPAGVRILTRDVALGGPAAVEDESLRPYFNSGSMQEAVRALEGGNANAAVTRFGSWIEQNEGHPWLPQAHFVRGYAAWEVDQFELALEELVRAATELPELNDYSYFFAADAAMQLEQHQRALELAANVDHDSVYGPRAWFLKARAMRQLGDNSGALQELSAFQNRYPDAWYADKVELERARAEEGSGMLEEAARTYRRVRTVYPGSSVEEPAEEGFQRVLRQLDAATRAALQSASSSETLRRANALYDRHRSENVIDLLDGLAPAWTPGSEEYCEGNYLVGRSYTKLRQHGDSLPWYDRVVDGCDGEWKLRALYNAGRGNWNADRDNTAIERFEQLVTEFATHSYADDAVLYIARIHRANGREQEFRQTLDRQIRDYPGGDMLKDAIWLLAAETYRSGDYVGLVAFVDELAGRYGEDDIYSRGRMRYFRARALEELDRDTEARAAFASLIREYPLGYYAMLSFQRLLRLDAEFARVLEGEIADGRAAVQGTPIPPDLVRDEGFVAGRILIRMGLFSLAEGEFDALGERMGGRRDVERALAMMLSHAGAWHLSYRAPAARVAYAESWPSADTREDWELAYPQPWEDEVRSWADEREIDRLLVYSIMREESAFQPTIESWANARGLMQLMIGTANDMAEANGRGRVSASQLFDPETNIELGTAFMSYLGHRFAMHPYLIAAGYNGGGGSVNSWLRARGDMPLDLWVEEIPYAQTRHYVKRVMKTWWTYRWLYAAERVTEVPFDLPSAN